MRENCVTRTKLTKGRAPRAMAKVKSEFSHLPWLKLVFDTMLEALSLHLH